MVYVSDICYKLVRHVIGTHTATRTNYGILGKFVMIVGEIRTRSRILEGDIRETTAIDSCTGRKHDRWRSRLTQKGIRRQWLLLDTFWRLARLYYRLLIKRNRLGQKTIEEKSSWAGMMKSDGFFEYEGRRCPRCRLMR